MAQPCSITQLGAYSVEEYLFYFTGFVAVLLIYICWLVEYWLSALWKRVPVDSATRTNFERLLRFHPQSLAWAVALIAGAILYRRLFVLKPGFRIFRLPVGHWRARPAALLPSAMPVINWRAFSLTLLLILLISLLWEATLGVPYGWWNFQDAQMIGIRITAWSRLPIEEVCVWIAVVYATVIVYEIVRRWCLPAPGGAERSSANRPATAYLQTVEARETRPGPTLCPQPLNSARSALPRGKASCCSTESLASSNPTIKAILARCFCSGKLTCCAPSIAA